MSKKNPGISPEHSSYDNIEKENIQEDSKVEVSKVEMYTFKSINYTYIIILKSFYF
jgi:hypothetical protein